MMRILILALMPLLLVGCKDCFCGKEAGPKFEMFTDVECIIGGETKDFKDVKSFDMSESGIRIRLKEEIDGYGTLFRYGPSVPCFAKTYKQQVNDIPLNK